MPRKKLMEPEEVEQAMSPEQTGPVEESRDAAVGSDEGSARDSAAGNAAEEPAAGAALEGAPPPNAETKVVDVGLPPADIPEPRAVEPPPEIPPEMEIPAEPSPAPAPEKSDRQAFFDLNFNELDRGLTAEERQEWNSIYASYRGRSALTGKIIGVDPLSITVRNKQTGNVERQAMYCAVVVPYQVRIVIPASEVWESGFAVASRRMAARSQRYYFSYRPSLHRDGVRTTCRAPSVGPRRCLVECFGHDINLTQRDLRYTAIPDLRDAYHPGEELDCIVKSYDAGNAALRISVKETESNPFKGAELRHPVGSRRQAGGRQASPGSTAAACCRGIGLSPCWRESPAAPIQRLPRKCAPVHPAALSGTCRTKDQCGATML